MELEYTLTISKKGSVLIKRVRNYLKLDARGCTLSAPVLNKIVDKLLPLFTDSSRIKITSFQEAWDDIIFLGDAFDRIMELKESYCTTWGKAYTDLRETLLRYRWNWIDSIERSKLTTPEKIALTFELGNSYALADYELLEKFGKITDKYLAFKKEVESYSYPYKDAVELQLQNFISFEDQVNKFESLVNEHGDALVNWGVHKCTRELGRDHHITRQLISKYQEKLLSKGVTKKDNSNKALERSRDLIKANLVTNQPTQEDYLRVFKQGRIDEAKSILSELTLESLLSLVPLKSKMVQEHISEITLSIELLDPSARNWDKLLLKHYSSEYLLRILDTVEMDEDFKLVLDSLVSKQPSIELQMTDKVFNRITKNLSRAETLSYFFLLTKEVMNRMDADEQVATLAWFAGFEMTYWTLGIERKVDKLPNYLAAVFDLKDGVYDRVKGFINDLPLTSFWAEQILKHGDKITAQKFLEYKSSDLRELVKILDIDYTPEAKDRIYYYTKISKWDQKPSDFFKKEDYPKVLKKLLVLEYKEVEGFLINEECKKVLHDNLHRGITLNPNFPKKTLLKLMEMGADGLGPLILQQFKYDEVSFLGDRTLGDCYPEILPENNLIELGNQNANFLKDKITHFPKDYLLKKFEDVDVFKSFIGNRVFRGNQFAYRYLKGIGVRADW